MKLAAAIALALWLTSLAVCAALALVRIYGT